MQVFESFEALQEFAAETQFSSHARVIRPNQCKSGKTIHKGINTSEELERFYQLSRGQSSDGLVWVETDMRALESYPQVRDCRACSPTCIETGDTLPRVQSTLLEVGKG